MGNHSIAIIGMGCVYPGAHSPEELWTNILAGRRYFRRSPDERLPSKYYYDPDPEVLGKTYCDRMAVISGWSFDPTEWKIPPITFNESEIVHWLSLYTATETLKNANINFEKTDKTRVGVILGNSGIGEFHRSYLLRNRWPFVERAVRRAVEKSYTGEQADSLVNAIRHYYESPFPELREDHLAGNMANVICGRIANYYDFRAAAYSVDGACASSLLAVINACGHIESGDMDVALAGGVDISLDPLEMVGFAKTQALAMDDIRPYDKRAAGMQTGEGCGIVALADEDYAKERGYHIHAIIKGWGISADGSGGITQPKVEGQMAAVRKAYERAGYDISTVGYIEGHGTGTTVGDKVEVTSIKNSLDQSGARDSVCWIGSIKANIGHTKAAAGVAGLIKATMALEKKLIPPHVSCFTPNPAFGRPLSTLRPAIRPDVWMSDTPRRAGVSAFGFGGVNTHVTLEEANPDGLPLQEEIDLLGSSQTSEVILLSGRSVRELKEKAEKLIAVANRMSQAEVTDLSAALAREKHTGAHRVAIVTTTPWRLAEQFKTVVSKLSEGLTLDELNSPENDIFASETKENPRMAALFPGQGSHRLNMAEHFLRRFGFVREMCQSFEARMYELTGESFKARVFRDVDGADEETKQKWSEELRETVFQQPSIISCSMAALKVLRHLGIEPSYATGHSLGEISALVAGGALEPVDALHIAALRAQAMNSAAGKGTGGMAAIGTDAEKADAFLKKHKLNLVISNFNSVRQNVVSGPIKEIDRAVKLCEKENIWARKLPVSHAFHSEAVAPASDELRKTLDDIPISHLEGAAICSTSTGEFLEGGTDLKGLLAKQIARPVLFVDAVKKIHEKKPDLWVEIGPGQVLSSLARDIIGEDGLEFYPTDLEREDDFHLVNRLVSRAFVLGFPVKTERLFEYRFHREFDPYNYNPVLIVNPCERPVEQYGKKLGLGGAGMPGELLPKEAADPSFEDYLKQRSGFLKQYIGLDYRNWPGTGVVPVIDEEPVTAEAVTAPEEKSDGVAGTASTMDAVIDWIVKRTGYPKDFVTPDKKLRDDLNLDSIKAGELALMLSKEMGRELPFDLGIVANASIEYLVETVEGFEGQRIATDDLASSNWIKTFGVELLPAPIDIEPGIVLASDSVMYLIGEDECSRTGALAEALTGKGLNIRRLTLERALDDNLEAHAAGVVMVLPEEEKSFFDLKPTEFHARVEGFATSLFQLMRKVLTSEVSEGGNFFCLIVRPVGKDDPGADMDGVAGFLKTLSLEYANPGFNWKWVSVPDSWEPDHVVQKTIDELTHLGERIEYHYNEDGQRLSPTSVQVGASGEKAPRLGGTDTILVSGGGKGITFEMAFELALKTGVKLGLLGSSPPPADDDTESELATNLEKLRGKGVRHLYMQADVTNHGAVMDAVRQIERKLGRVTAILHGAGISRFSEFSNMKLEDYLLCIRVKATGLYNMLAAVPPKKLKALHVISSVLGRTGMFRQADYTFANAWLDGATRSVLRKFPKIHGFSVGYTVWEGTGIGAKSGSLEMLQTVGVTPISVEDGVNTYIELATKQHPFKTFVSTGRLNIDVEKRLMPTIKIPQWRFLENVRRFVPGVDLVADAHLTHEKDRYVPEHVFAGTPLMPTVLGLEAMTQAAMACIGTDEIPVIKLVQLKRPMIIPEEDGLKVRTIALAEPAEDGVTTVNVKMSSESIGFDNNHFEIRCLFGLPEETELPARPELPKNPYPKSPEEFSPSPLFQGRFFRRITNIFDVKEGDETITEITVPVKAQYYGSEFDQSTKTPSPAIRDAMLQSAALMVPPGYLPESIREVRFFRPLKDGEKLICHAKAVESDEDILKADITLFDQDGKVVELLKGLVVKATSTEADLGGTRKTKVVDMAQLDENLHSVLNGYSFAVNMVHHGELSDAPALEILPDGERSSVLKDVSEPRHASVLANLVATRQAVQKYFRDTLKKDISASEIGLTHEESGKPELVISSSEGNFTDLDVSLADSNETSTAVIGPRPVGIDIEIVETRDTETWRGLLGNDGYALAMKLQRETGESFDMSATRVWTLIEAGKKANGLDRTVPRFDGIIDNTWAVFTRPEGNADHLACAVLSDEGRELVITLNVKQPEFAGTE